MDAGSFFESAGSGRYWRVLPRPVAGQPDPVGGVPGGTARLSRAATVAVQVVDRRIVRVLASGHPETVVCRLDQPIHCASRRRA